MNDADPNSSHVRFGSLSNSVKQQDINKDEIRVDKNMNGVFLVSNEKSPSKIFQIQRRFCIKREMMV